MRAIPLRLGVLTVAGVVALTACTSDPATNSMEGTTTGTTVETFENGTTVAPFAGPMVPDARLGVELCEALLPALDGQLEGLDRYASPEVLDTLEDGGATIEAQPVALPGDSDRRCLIRLGDWVVELRLRNEQQLGDFATSAQAEPLSDAERDAARRRDLDARVWRENPEACNGDVSQIVPGETTHVAVEVAGLDGLVLGVTCEAFATRFRFDLMGWTIDGRFDLEFEQWIDGALVDDNTVVIGNPTVDEDGNLTNTDVLGGAAECGFQQTWTLDDGRFVLIEARECDEAGADVADWPVLYTAT